MKANALYNRGFPLSGGELGGAPASGSPSLAVQQNPTLI
jgi:hypothetical protein